MTRRYEFYFRVARQYFMRGLIKSVQPHVNIAEFVDIYLLRLECNTIHHGVQEILFLSSHQDHTHKGKFSPLRNSIMLFEALHRGDATVLKVYCTIYYFTVGHSGELLRFCAKKIDSSR